MPKRKIAVQNKGTEQQQQQASTSTRSSTKRANNEEPTSSKKPKLEDVHADKENVPKRQKSKSKPAPKKERTPSPPPVVEQPESTDESEDDFLDQYDDEVDDDDDDEEDEMQLQPTTNSAQCVDHPTNKQYVIYPNGGRNGEPFVISKTARFWNQKYFKVMRNVSPDAYGMYIYNDFGNYGELEVVENCLLDLTKAIFMTQRRLSTQATMIRKPADSVNYVLAFRRIEALTMVLDNADGMTNIDDGERYLQMVRVVGACYVTVLRGLFPQAMFTPIDKIDRNLVKKLTSISRQLPNLKAVLEKALTVGHLLVTIGNVSSAYTKILQIIYCNWMSLMENTTIDLKTKPANMTDKLWKALNHATTIDPNHLEEGEPESFDFLNELRDYKIQHGLGGDFHDLSKWSRRDRAEYSLDRLDLFSGFLF